jgi:hypothetical protein
MKFMKLPILGAFSILLLLSLLLLSAPARADVKNIWVGVNGVTCPT